MKLQIFAIPASLAAFGTTGQAANAPFSHVHGLNPQTYTHQRNRKSDKCEVVGDITSNVSKCGLKLPEQNSSFIRPSEKSEDASGGTIPGQ